MATLITHHCQAYVNHGRWVADCPRPYCGNALKLTPNQAVFETLEKLKNSGSILKIGASVYGMEAAVAAMEHGGYDCLQIAYSALDRRIESRVLAVAKRTGVGLVARSVLLKGALTHRYGYLSTALSGL